MIKKLLTLFLLVHLCQACDEGFQLEKTNYSSKLVIDGWIETDEYPTVVLTKSASYFSRIDSTVLASLIASRAKVTISDGIKEEVLTLKKNDLFFPPYIYQGTEIKGEAGKSYVLTVYLENKIYTSETTIPEQAQFDSLWFETLEEDNDRGILYGKISDNGEEENYYRIFTHRASKDNKFIPIYLSTLGDQFFNGQSFTLSLLRGPEQVSAAMDDIYFEKGDTVLVKIAAIDRSHFDFWRTLERELYVTGNPFSSTGNEVLSNISGGALGVWGGYNPNVHLVICK